MLTRPQSPQVAPGDSGVAVEGDGRRLGAAVQVLHPGAGDKITGFVTRGNGVSVHRADCVNVQHLVAVPARAGRVRALVAQGELQVPGRDPGRGARPDRPAVRRHQVDLRAARQHPVAPRSATRRDRVALSKFTFEMGDPEHLRHVLKAVRNVDGVYDAQARNQLATPRVSDPPASPRRNSIRQDHVAVAPGTASATWPHLMLLGRHQAGPRCCYFAHRRASGRATLLMPGPLRGMREGHVADASPAEGH